VKETQRELPERRTSFSLLKSGLLAEAYASTSYIHFVQVSKSACRDNRSDNGENCENRSNVSIRLVTVSVLSLLTDAGRWSSGSTPTAVILIDIVVLLSVNVSL
jgi:hypothetical protein